MSLVNSVSEMSTGKQISVGMEVEDDNVRFFVGSINDSHNLCSIDKTKSWTVKTTTDPMRKCMEQGNYSVNAALLRVVPHNAAAVPQNLQINVAT